MVLRIVCLLFILPATAGKPYETLQVLFFLQNYSYSLNEKPVYGVVEHLSALPTGQAGDRQDSIFNIKFYPTGFT